MTYVIGGGVALGLLVLLALWYLLGKGPRQWRSYQATRRLMDQGEYAAAWQIIQRWKQGTLSRSWQNRWNEREARYQRGTSQGFFRDKDYEKDLEILEKSNVLLGQPPEEARMYVVSLMVEEARALFSRTVMDSQEEVQNLLTRILLVDSHCAEAYFWQALVLLRDKKTEEATRILTNLVYPGRGESFNEIPFPQEFTEKFIDPPLYLGALLLEQNQPREALRCLTEANRIDNNCPFVVCQLGIAMIESGGDTQFAIKALERALGNRGFAIWSHQPERAWVEAFPDNKSYVRKLAVNHPFVCPLWGDDFFKAQRQGLAALAKGFYQQGQFEQAVKLYQRVAHESAPSLGVLRGLGLSLARLGRCDEAFKHLRAAHELENPKDPITTGYLALCAAKGKPAFPEDKANNVNWSVGLVRNIDLPGNREWVDLLNQIFTEARSVGIHLKVEDQLHLCEQLQSATATDSSSAQAFHHLFATFPGSFRKEFSWLYCRSAQLLDLQETHTLDTYNLLFSEEDSAREFYQEKNWDFAELEYSFLEKYVRHSPGEIPPVFGEHGSARVENILSKRVRALEEENQQEKARDTAQVWALMTPTNPKALDCLARLHFVNQDETSALEVLQSWHHAAPESYLPLIRQAILFHRQERWEECHAALRRVLEITSSPQKADLAFLGAKLLLARWQKDSPEGRSVQETANSLGNVRHFLEECLAHNPHHKEALGLLASVLCLQEDKERIAPLIGSMEQVAESDPQSHFFLAHCYLETGKLAKALEASQAASENDSLASDCAFLSGWIFLSENEPDKAALNFLKVLSHPDSPSLPYARALLGGLRFFQGSPQDAIDLWKGLEPASLARFDLAQPLAQTIYLTALQEMAQGDYAGAAEKFREAGKRGLREPRLGALLSLALLKAGQSLLYQSDG